MIAALSTIAKFSNGKKKGDSTGSIPVYGGNGIFDYTDEANSENCVVIGRVGAYCGSVHYEPHKCWVSDNAIRCEAKQGTDIRFLYYLLKGLKLEQRQIGTSQPLLTQGILNAIELDNVPSIDRQKEITDLLWAFDQLIEVNRKANDYLTTLASAIYREFVSHASGSMGVLADLVDLRKDSTKAGKRPELPYLPIDAIPMKSIGISEFKPNHEAKSSLQLFQRDDIIIGAMRVYFHRVVLAPCEGITRNTCFVLRPKNQLLREYALLTCFQPEAIEYANARAKGSTMPYAVWEGSFEAYPVLIPNESELEMFSKRVSPIIDKLRDSFDENGRLAKLRDALLPKLMSGEIDVSKVEMPTQPNNHLSDN